jgi:hypothetical protein
MRSRIYVVDFARALPASSELARVMGRLLVLRADILIEAHGIGEVSIPSLDVLDRKYRLLYFIRSNARTLYSGQRLLERLAGVAEFKRWLSEADRTIVDRWRKNKDALTNAMPTIKRLRNDIGAHTEESIEQAVAEIKPGTLGYMEYHSRHGMLPRLAFEIASSAFMKGVALDEIAKAINDRLTLLGDAVAAFMRATNVALELYQARHGGLFA